MTIGFAGSVSFADSVIVPTSYNGSDITEELNSSGTIGGLTWSGADRAYTIGKDVILIFTNTLTAGSFSLGERWSADARLLLVAGGGAGGFNNENGRVSAGGGAGGMITVDDYVAGEGLYSVSVGAGGAAPTAKNTHAPNGGNSILSKNASAVYTALGGGAGGNACDGDKHSVAAGGTGGSGGGSSMYYKSANYGGMPGDKGLGTLDQGNDGGKASGYNNYRNAGGGGAVWYANMSFKGQIGGAGVAGQGNAGGTAHDDSWNYRNGGGGGGAGTPGADGVSETQSGAGGDGLPCDITGETIYYAGGGAGGKCSQGGLGGGGSFSSPNGVDGLGGGGVGFGGGVSAGRGGNGIVVVRIVKAIPKKGLTVIFK